MPVWLRNLLWTLVTLAVMTGGIWWLTRSGYLPATELPGVTLPTSFLSSWLPDRLSGGSGPTPAGTTGPSGSGAATGAAVAAKDALRATGSQTGDLTVVGVIAATNAARASGGLAALRRNAQLSASAQAKLQDMLKRQYFEHVSPDTGAGPGQLATAAGYDYITIGENLALGDFGGDQKLVDAWMASPGHRANIMNVKFEEIGVAVGRGMYQGAETWMAVQEFGRPASDCPQVNATLDKTITTDQATLSSLRTEADRERAALDAMPKPTTQAEADAYDAKVAEYNDKAHQINDLNKKLQGEVTTYNAQVKAYNACAG